MKTRFGICPVCFRERLTEAVGGVGVYWRCLNRGCGRTFFSETPHLTRRGDPIVDGDIGITEDHFKASERFRIPPTEAGQIYELRRMFRR